PSPAGRDDPAALRAEGAAHRRPENRAGQHGAGGEALRRPSWPALLRLADHLPDLRPDGGSGPRGPRSDRRGPSPDGPDRWRQGPPGGTRLWWRHGPALHGQPADLAGPSAVARGRRAPFSPYSASDTAAPASGPRLVPDQPGLAR